MEKEYVILNLEKEYPGYTGTEKWMIITDQDPAVLKTMCPEIVPFLDSSVVVGTDVGRVIIDYKNNDRKHERHYECIDYSNSFVNDYEGIQELDMLNSVWLEEAVEQLPETQKRRIMKRYVGGYSMKEIAKAERVSFQSVATSIRRGIAFLKSIAAEGGDADV